MKLGKRFDVLVRSAARAVASPWFFRAVLALFVLNALWVALSYRFPALFDESYHMGIIRFYAGHLSPFLANQPLSFDQLGDIAHNPSFLFHYLMSFPYRLFTVLGLSNAASVISLRLLDIAFVTVGLLLFRNVLLRMGIKRSITHAALLLFALLPVMPFLAGQVNYDNMLFPLAALSVWLCQEILRREKVSYLLLVALAGVALVSAMVKYTFLPLLVAEVLFVTVALGRRHGWKELWQAFTTSYRATPKGRRVAVAVVLLIIMIVFAGRYGTNVVHYGTPAPECDQTLSMERCQKYGVWLRNYTFAHNNPGVSKDPTVFSHSWSLAIRRDMFRVAANTSPANQPAYSPVYRIMQMVSGATLVVGIVFAIYYWRQLRRNQMVWFSIAVAGLYVAALWLQNFADYLHTGHYVGTQGRYLLPVAPLILAVVLMGYAQFIRTRLRRICAVGFLVFVLLCFTQGGGALAGIAAGDSTWYWEGSRMIEANQALQNIVKPLIHATSN